MAKFFPADDATRDKVKRVQTLTEQLTMLEINANALDRQVNEAKAAAGVASLDLEAGKISRKEYDTLARKVGDLEAERTQKLFAAAAARDALRVAKQELFEAKAGDRKREAESYGVQREKCVSEIADAIATLWNARQRLHSINDKIVQSFGASVTLQHGGTLLGADELQRALEIELARVSYSDPTPGKMCPPLPGAKALILGNPAKATPLVEVVKQANSTLVKRAVTGYSEAQPKPAKPKAAPAPVEATPTDPDDALLVPTGPTVDVATVMATLGRRRMA